jgi:hypothetical protein
MDAIGNSCVTLYQHWLISKGDNGKRYLSFNSLGKSYLSFNSLGKSYLSFNRGEFFLEINQSKTPSLGVRRLSSVYFSHFNLLL